MFIDCSSRRRTKLLFANVLHDVRVISVLHAHLVERITHIIPLLLNSLEFFHTNIIQKFLFFQHCVVPLLFLSDLVPELLLLVVFLPLHTLHVIIHILVL